AQVTTRHHDAVADFDDGVQRLVVSHGLGALYLGDDPRLAAGGLNQFAGLLDIAAVARKRHGHVVHVELCRQLDVFAVFVGQAGGRDAAAAPVDAFVVRQRAAHGDNGVYLVVFDMLDL